MYQPSENATERRGGGGGGGGRFDVSVENAKQTDEYEASRWFELEKDEPRETEDTRMTSKETAKGKSSWKTLTGRGNLDREEENGDTRRATMYSIVDVGGSILEESRVFVWYSPRMRNNNRQP